MNTNLRLKSGDAASAFLHAEGPGNRPSRGTLIAQSMQQLIDELPEQIGLLDEHFNILVVNEAWRNIARQYGYSDGKPGHNYLDFCAKRAAEGYEPAARAVAALREFASGKRDEWRFVYNGGSNWDDRDFQLRVHRIQVQGVDLLMIARLDLTEIHELRRAKEDLTVSLVESHANERQRLARELHDSTSQLLVSIGLLLSGLRHNFVGKRTSALIAEIEGLLGEALGEIRTISFLAYPPALKSSNLPDALWSLVEGFARRAKLELSCHIDDDLGSIPTTFESAIYRVAQEALSNVHRHASAARLSVRLCVRRSAIHLIVADDGIGISREAIAGTGDAGVGIAGMRQRVAEIGGRLAVLRNSPGTAVIARVKLPPCPGKPRMAMLDMGQKARRH
jgi:two-component system NarL family sensor kinase